MNLRLFLLLTIFTINYFPAQEIPKDTIFGKVKSIREKVIYLDEKENNKALDHYMYDYSGLLDEPEGTIHNFRDMWFSYNGCYFLNHVLDFDTNHKIISDTYLDKNDDFFRSYHFIYNKENKIKFKIDSSKFSTDKTTYYYQSNGDKTEIYQSSDGDIFWHTFEKFKDKKLDTYKIMDEYGIVNEYKYYYNSAGKLSYRYYKNPNIWKKTEEDNYIYGVQDTIGTYYKDLINEYDSRERLIKSSYYSLNDDKKHEKPIITNIETYEYDAAGNISIKNNKFYYNYDKRNRLVESRIYQSKKEKPKVYHKYIYNDLNQVEKLEYFEDNKVYKIVFHFKYDEKNNWIEIVKNINGKDIYKWIRQLEYYQ